MKNWTNTYEYNSEAFHSYTDVATVNTMDTVMDVGNFAAIYTVAALDAVMAVYDFIALYDIHGSVKLLT